MRERVVDGEKERGAAQHVLEGVLASLADFAGGGVGVPMAKPPGGAPGIAPRLEA